jgi:hypothetical protein
MQFLQMRLMLVLLALLCLTFASAAPFSDTPWDIRISEGETVVLQSKLDAKSRSDARSPPTYLRNHLSRRRFTKAAASVGQLTSRNFVPDFPVAAMNVPTFDDSSNDDSSNGNPVTSDSQNTNGAQAEDQSSSRQGDISQSSSSTEQHPEPTVLVSSKQPPSAIKQQSSSDTDEAKHGKNWYGMWWYHKRISH